MECQICFENFDTNNFIPKILSKCGHSFCRICLERLSTNSLIIICPICREQTRFTKKENFTTNYSLLETIEKDISSKETKELLLRYKYFDNRDYKYLNQTIIRKFEPEKLILRKIVNDDFIYIEEIEANQNYSIFTQQIRRNRRYCFNKNSFFRFFFNEYSFNITFFRKSSPCRHSFSCIEHNIRKVVLFGGLALILKYPIRFLLSFFIKNNDNLSISTKRIQGGFFCLWSMMDITKCVLSFYLDYLIKIK